MDLVTILALLFIVWITYRLNNTKESFTIPDTSLQQYIQDVRNLAGTVGPYIGNTYTYLRDKYLNSMKGHPIPPTYTPLMNDPTLADPLLPIARVQVKAWIDSAQKMWAQKYGVSKLQDFAKTWNLAYVETPDKILTITYTQGGVKHLFIL